MMRFWIDRSLLKDNRFLIKDQLYHHICHVAKIKKGELFELFCEGLQKYHVHLSFVSSSYATASILKSFPVPPLKKPYLNLAVSLPRLYKVDFLIEKMVELGVKEFQPFTSAFSFLKKSSQITSSRKNRWKKIKEQSLAQSGRTESLLIKPCCKLQDIKIPPSDIAFFAYEGEQKTTFFEQIKKFPKTHAIWLFIGSEGGFSKEEVKTFCSVKNVFVGSFGNQILRVETACLFGLSVLKYHYHL